VYFYIFTGPCAAGKNTVATLVARSVDKGVHIDIDRLRAMVVQPHKAPWEGEEGKAQQRLAIENGCILAQQFIQEGYSVAISDLLSDSTARVYKKLLHEYPFKIIRLIPSFSEVKKRDVARGQRLKEDEVDMLYKQQEQLTLYDVTIDNTHMKPEEVVQKLIQ
jgi:adenylate kinase family enzyme